MKFISSIAGLLLAASVSFITTTWAQTEVQWWHAMSGVNGKRIDKMVADFNASQSEYKVVPIYKGNYTETVTAAIAAFRAKQQPHIVQVFEVALLQ